MASELTGDKNQPYFLATGAPAIDVDPGQVADYAAKVGNHKEGTAFERGALSGKDLWEGLLFTEWDTGLIWSYQPTFSGGWVIVAAAPTTVTVGTTAWPSTSFFTLWSATGGFTPRLVKTGKRVEIFGAATRSGAGANTSTIITVPVGWRPATDTYLGGGASGNNDQFTLRISTAGVIGVPSGYGVLAAVTVMPLFGYWYTA